MKAILTLATVGAIALTVVTSGTTHAQSFEQGQPLVTSDSFSKLINKDIWGIGFYKPEPATPLIVEKKSEKAPEKVTAPEPPKPIEYTVVSGDNLSKIAEAHNTTWVRLFQKNTNINIPDIINIGDVVVIPAPDEVLVERPIPATTLPTPAVTEPVRGSGATYTAPARTYNGNSSGNTYTAGNCTWYVKNRRPDLPNNLGNADTWTARASAQGIPTGYTPRAGAVGQLGMHVVYVESVNSDGTFNLSEMNYGGLYKMNSRTVSPSGWSFIY